VLYVIPRAVEAGLGYDSLTAGPLLLPFAVVFAVVSLSLVPIQRRLGVRTRSGAWRCNSSPSSGSSSSRSSRGGRR
jgi:hypothetical protein